MAGIWESKRNRSQRKNRSQRELGVVVKEKWELKKKVCKIELAIASIPIFS